VLFKSEYLPWRQQFRLDLLISSVACLGERVLERLLFPGLHRSHGRMLTEDPSRIDSITTLLAEAIGLFGLVWLFTLTLYAISYLTRRPMKSFAPTLITGILLGFVFVGSMSSWFQMPNLPPPA
jgi:hypothetical protein